MTGIITEEEHLSVLGEWLKTVSGKTTVEISGENVLYINGNNQMGIPIPKELPQEEENL